MLKFWRKRPAPTAPSEYGIDYDFGMKDRHEIRVGIASPEEMKNRLLAAARGEGPPVTQGANIWMAPEALFRRAEFSKDDGQTLITEALTMRQTLEAVLARIEPTVAANWLIDGKPMVDLIKDALKAMPDAEHSRRD